MCAIQKNAGTLGCRVTHKSPGSAIGTLLSPALAEHLGRRGGLLASATLNAIGSLMCLFYLYFFELVLIGRLLMGFSLGVVRLNNYFTIKLNWYIDLKIFFCYDQDQHFDLILKFCEKL
uniref:Major facilitator superfamily (MFS) profile domain-containing protein n=1 Tax=Romanomermis culicivorax TaxID=13658 RepID=A0A915HUY6_ROMCU